MFLALDTSTLTLSLALATPDGALVAEESLGPPQRQSELLPGAVSALLERHGHDVRALTGVVCGLGPGSFTGLRIGLATAKGLAYPLRLPLAGASSLAAVAFDGPADRELWAVATVKKGEVYLGRYRRTAAGVTALADEVVRTVAELADDTRRAGDEVLVLGPALLEVRAPLKQLGVPEARVHPGVLLPRAAALLALALPLPAYDEAALFRLEPRYLRSSGAEDNPKFPPLPGVEPVSRLKDD